MKKIYLACPYTSDDAQVERNRACAANVAAGKIIQLGYVVFSPISHGHAIAMDSDIPGDWGFWQKQVEPFIGWCDELWVLMLLGWRESKGVRAEIEIARRLRKGVSYHSPESLDVMVMEYKKRIRGGGCDGHKKK